MNNTTAPVSKYPDSIFYVDPGPVDEQEWNRERRHASDVEYVRVDIAESALRHLRDQLEAMDARISCAAIPMIDECDIKEWHHIATAREKTIAELESHLEEATQSGIDAAREIGDALAGEIEDWHKLADQRSAEIVRLDRELAAVTAERDQYRDDWMALSQDDGKLERELERVTAERDAFTANLTAVRGERSEVKAIIARARQWITDSEVNTLLHYISDLESTEAAWRSAYDVWLAETAARDARIAELHRQLDLYEAALAPPAQKENVSE